MGGPGGEGGGGTEGKEEYDGGGGDDLCLLVSTIISQNRMRLFDDQTSLSALNVTNTNDTLAESVLLG